MSFAQPKDFEVWASEMRSAQGQWVVDPIHSKPGDFLVSFGNEKGIYLMAYGQKIQGGRYEGAVPHIGEALFTVYWTAEAKSEAEAVAFIARRIAPCVRRVK